MLVQDTNGEQKSIYFISKVLQCAEVRYQKIEKVALVLVFSARRLSLYFQCHPIMVRADQPIKNVLSKLELAGRNIAWSIELSEYGIMYEPRTTIKAQAFDYFISELTNPAERKILPSWSVFVDGSSNPKGKRVGIILDSEEGDIIEHSLRFDFPSSNNQA